MKIKKKPKENLINKMLEQNNYRGELEKIYLKFMLSIIRRHSLMRTILSLNHKSELNADLVELATGQYISSIISCWETFFRDIIVFVINNNKSLNSKFEKLCINKNIDLKIINKQGLSTADLFVNQFNFQNASEICEVLNLVLSANKNNLEEFIELSLFDDVIFLKPNYILYWIQQKDDLQEKIGHIIHKTLGIRHKIVHDSNYILEFNGEYMTMFEDCFIIIPQLIATLISKKYNLNIIISNIKQHKHIIRFGIPKEEEKYLILSAKDFTEDRWELVNE